ncbi:hypothetical protein HF086_006467 [Spodoptera exigua]|uniref:Kazal-like domain-containing protein n=1 Tax=Spodoptera exigua TaxID=7107 RepID=A0A922MZA5_SPOEX|nr:hypothetical protein HF086_006467 [Spodoptera exigua]
MILKSIRIWPSLKLITITATWIVFAIVSINKYAQATSYASLKEEFGLIDPYLLDEEAINVVDLENLTDCDCPRVHFPVCAKNGDTYVNHCILRCSEESEFVRFGSCISYRRMDSFAFNLSIPTKWKNLNDHSQIEANEPVDKVYVEIPKKN